MERKRACITTNPYRLLVRGIPPDYIPFVVKSSKELPTGRRGIEVRETLG